MVKVRDMMPSLRWGMRMQGDVPAHMLVACRCEASEHARFFHKTECGAWLMPWERRSILDANVCKRCLRATEKYA